MYLFLKLNIGSRRCGYITMRWLEGFMPFCLNRQEGGDVHVIFDRAYAVHVVDEPGDIARSTDRGGIAPAPAVGSERAAPAPPGARGWSERGLVACNLPGRSTMEIDPGLGKRLLDAASLIAICVGSVVGWILGLLALWGFFNVI